MALFFACLSWVYAICCYRSLSQIKRDQLEYNKLFNEQLSVCVDRSEDIDQRIENLEQRLQTIKESQGELRQQDLDFSYVQAQKLIEQGVDAPTIIANSGLSPSEVNLMQLLHQQNNPL